MSTNRDNSVSPLGAAQSSEDRGANSALDKWIDILGPAAVATDEATCSRLGTATFDCPQTVRGVLRPRDKSQVAACVRVANEYRVALYPISRGRNWGLGSSVPPRSGCFVVDLQGLNRIVRYDATFGYLTVEPGVTFEQASRYLDERSARHFAAVIGGPPDASLIANALERGDGLGPTGERCSHMCNLEVVLANGSVIRTGFGRFPAARAKNLTKWGVGPHYDGLFSQSNLGIVTEATIWLAARPTHPEVFFLTMSDSSKLGALAERLRELAEQHVLRPNCFAIWNDYKAIAARQQFPWNAADPLASLPADLSRQLGTRWGDAAWVGMGGLYSASRAHAQADRAQIKRHLKGIAQRIYFFSPRRAALAKAVTAPIRRVIGVDIEPMLQQVFHRSVFFGYPTRTSLRSLYWRKKMPIPQELNPDRDRCGMFGACVAIPLQAEDLSTAESIACKVIRSFGLEPNLAVVFPSSRHAQMFPFILYDRDISGADAAAKRCHDATLSALMDAGYFPYRLGIQSMDCLPVEPHYQRFAAEIKQSLDPHGVLSPGRYEARSVRQ